MPAENLPNAARRQAPLGQTRAARPSRVNREWGHSGSIVRHPSGNPLGLGLDSEEVNRGVPLSPWESSRAAELDRALYELLGVDVYELLGLDVDAYDTAPCTLAIVRQRRRPLQRMLGRVDLAIWNDFVCAGPAAAERLVRDCRAGGTTEPRTSAVARGEQSGQALSGIEERLR
jgi:hypothetical protein